MMLPVSVPRGEEVSNQAVPNALVDPFITIENGCPLTFKFQEMPLRDVFLMMLMIHA